MTTVRRFANWVVVVTMLVTTLAPGSGHFQCLRGMSQAGPACPLCHGGSTGPAGAPSGKPPCCRFVQAGVTPDVVAPSLGGLTSPGSSPSIQLVSGDGFCLAPSQQISWRPCPDRAAPSTQSPLYLSNFLRL